MLPPPRLHHQIHQSHRADRRLRDNRFQEAANRRTRSRSYCTARSCCFRNWEVRLVVRCRSDLHSGDPTRWWMGHVTRWWMDLGDRLSMARSHCLSRSLIRCQSRSANSCQIRWWNGWLTRERYSFHFRCNWGDRYWTCSPSHRCSMVRLLGEQEVR